MDQLKLRPLGTKARSARFNRMLVKFDSSEIGVRCNLPHGGQHITAAAHRVYGRAELSGLRESNEQMGKPVAREVLTKSFAPCCVVRD
jgi:hypothetical protein